MKKISILFLSILLLTGCSKQEAVKNEAPAVTSSSATSVRDEVFLDQLPSTSEVRSVDDEYNEYINHALGFSVKIPKRVLAAGHYLQDQDNPTVPIRMVESGEVLTFSRPFYPVWPYKHTASGVLSVNEDLSSRHPYFNTKYENDPGYPYQIYMAKAETIDDVRAFMKRAYGDGCTVDEKEGSMYDNPPGLMTFTVGPSVSNCPGYAPVGDVLSWYRNNHVVIGKQAPPGVYFAKPYNPIDMHTDYDFNVSLIQQ